MDCVHAVYSIITNKPDVSSTCQSENTLIDCAEIYLQFFVFFLLLNTNVLVTVVRAKRFWQQKRLSFFPVKFLWQFDD